MKGIPEPIVPFVERGPGARLREAREAAGITVERVATSLLLDSDTIRALEADAFDRLPAPTFVRGYLRGYARVVGLPAGPILEMYNRRGFEPPPLATGVSESSQAHTSDTAVRVVTYAVAVVLVVLVALWWHSQEGGGFGIGVDLFDWSSDPDSEADPNSASESHPDSDSDSSLAFADAPGTAAFGEPAESTWDGEPLAPSTRQDTGLDDGTAGSAPADVAVPEAMTESETSTTSTPRPEIVDEGSATVEADRAAEASPAAGTPPIAGDVAAADDAPAVAGEPVAGDDAATADTLTANGEPAAGDDTANAAGPTTAGAGTVEADSTAVTTRRPRRIWRCSRLHRSDLRRPRRIWRCSRLHRRRRSGRYCNSGPGITHRYRGIAHSACSGVFGRGGVPQCCNHTVRNRPRVRP